MTKKNNTPEIPTISDDSLVSGIIEKLEKNDISSFDVTMDKPDQTVTISFPHQFEMEKFFVGVFGEEKYQNDPLFNRVFNQTDWEYYVNPIEIISDDIPIEDSFCFSIDLTIPADDAVEILKRL
jgi:hypothetical protein